MIYTSNYATAKNHPDAIGTSRGVPKWFTQPVFKELAPPTWEMVNLNDKEKFTYAYKKYLTTLDVHEWAEKCEGKILLCYENISKDYCHREILLEWFNENGYPCEEWRTAPKLKNRKTIGAKACIVNPLQESLFGEEEVKKEEKKTGTDFRYH